MRGRKRGQVQLRHEIKPGIEGHSRHSRARRGRKALRIWQLTWEHENKELQVEVVGGPSGGLVLRDRGDDGDVVLGIGRVQQGIETPRPWGDFP